MFTWMWGRGSIHSLFVGVQTGAAAMEISVEGPQKLTDLLFYPSVPLLGIYPKDSISYYRGIRSSLVIAALLTVDRTCAQPRYPSKGAWIVNMWSIYTTGYCFVV